jgi:hypothetical protein
MSTRAMETKAVNNKGLVNICSLLLHVSKLISTCIVPILMSCSTVTNTSDRSVSIESLSYSQNWDILPRNGFDTSMASQLTFSYANQHLLMFNAERLSEECNQTGCEEYRIFFFPAFKPAISLSFAKVNSDLVRLTYKKRFSYSYDQKGYDSGCVVYAIYDKLSRDLDKANFWGKPSLPTKPDTYDDGNSVVIEAVKNGRYHFVYRHVPEVLDKETDLLCQRLLHYMRYGPNRSQE